MLPTLRPGQIVLFTDRKGAKIGDIVMFRHDGKEKIKRLARNNAGKIYVLGDNPSHSTDSRSFGWLEGGAIGGRLVWPRRKPRD
jgi:phage repressor protein C with HTH and peptisase S24 domain